MLIEPEIKRGKRYAVLTVVAECEKFEWQERYLCLLNELNDAELIFKGLLDMKILPFVTLSE